MKECNVTKDGNCGINFDKTSCPVPGLRCTSTSICSTYDQDRDQVDYEFRPECPEECNQTFDNKCGKDHGLTTCPYDGQYCSKSGQCGWTDKFKKNSQTNNNFNPKCPTYVWYGIMKGDSYGIKNDKWLPVEIQGIDK